MIELCLKGLELKPSHLRALRRLHLLGPAKVGRWKRATKKVGERWVRSDVVQQLWHARLIHFDWLTDRYSITDAGLAMLLADDAPLPIEALAMREAA